MSDFPERLSVGKCHPFRGGNFYVSTAGIEKNPAEYIRADVAAAALRDALTAADARVAELEAERDAFQGNADDAYAKWLAADARIAELTAALDEAQALRADALQRAARSASRGRLPTKQPNGRMRDERTNLPNAVELRNIYTAG